VISEDIHSDHSMIEVGVLTLENVVVGVFFVVQRVQSFEDELEDGGQVLWRGSGDEDVAEAVHYRGCNRDPECS